MSITNHVGKFVLHRDSSQMGTVVGQDGLTYRVSMMGTVKSYTRHLFYRRFKVLEDIESPKLPNNPILPEKPQKPLTTLVSERVVGVGMDLREMFDTLLRTMATQSVEIIVRPATKNHLERTEIKYNGLPVFEIEQTKYRLTVRCRVKSLTAQNYSRAHMIYPKKWKQGLSAEFRFTSLDDRPLLRSIMVDGLYYGQVKEGI